MARVNDPELTKARLHLVVEEMYDRIVKGEPPTMTLPVRTKNNIGFDKKLGVYKYGKKRSTRDATSLGSAKNLLRALHVVEFDGTDAMLAPPSSPKETSHPLRS